MHYEIISGCFRKTSKNSQLILLNIYITLCHVCDLTSCHIKAKGSHWSSDSLCNTRQHTLFLVMHCYLPHTHPHSHRYTTRQVTMHNNATRQQQHRVEINLPSKFLEKFFTTTQRLAGCISYFPTLFSCRFYFPTVVIVVLVVVVAVVGVAL